MWGERVRREVAWTLGDAFLAGPWTEEGLRGGALDVLSGSKPRWLDPLIRRTLTAYRDVPRDRRRELHTWLDTDLAGREHQWRAPQVRHRLLPVAEMGHRRWDVPTVPTVADLAAFLDLHVPELARFADTRSLERTAKDEPLRHYRYRWLPRAASMPRLIEAPKRHLRELQRRVLHDILDLIPPHPDATGFRRGHSPLTNARRHVGRQVVVGFDLEDFFAAITPARVYSIFRSAGYPESVAYRLTGLCTNVVPVAVWDSLARPTDPREVARYRRLGLRLASPHLPQGAPTSPALANLAALHLDYRLAGLAAKNGAVYSRYADDISFSGGKQLLTSTKGFRRVVAEIAEDEGLRLNPRKTRLTTAAGRQLVTGVVVNAQPNLPRSDYDRLRAALHEATHRGPERANRNGVPDFRTHLLGRIAWAEQLNPTRGQRLRAMFAEIVW